MSKTPLTWRIERRKVKDLKPYEKNPRRISDAAMEKLKERIQKRGLHDVLKIDTNDVLLSGNQRQQALIALSFDEVDVMIPNRTLTEKEREEVMLESNRNDGEWNYEELKKIELGTLLDMGFGDEELSDLWDDVDILEDNFNVARAIKEIKVPRVKPGEMYQLGDHRLLCGDSTDPDHVARLMGEDLADVVYSDPPYNIGLDYNAGTEGGKKEKYGGNYSGKKDSKLDAQYAEFIDTTIKNGLAHTKPNAHVFYWCDEKYIGLFQMLFRDNKVDTNRVCLWIKNNSFPKPQVAFNKVYEPCIYGTRGKPYLNKSLNGLNEIMNKEVSTGNQGLEDIFEMINLWMVKRDDTQSYLHPTQKPVPLAERPLKRCSRPGHIVLDLFGGSGSTLIACEQIKRQARLIEQDPVFATVIVDRWEQFTNQKAKKL